MKHAQLVQYQIIQMNNGENIEDYNIEDYIEQYKQYDNEEESNIVQAVLNSSYYSEIENIITSIQIFIKQMLVMMWSTLCHIN